MGDLMKEEEAFKSDTDGMDLEQWENAKPRRQSMFAKFSMSGRKRRPSVMSAETIEEGDEDSDEDPNERSAMNSSGLLNSNGMSKDRRKTVDLGAATGAGQSVDDLGASKDFSKLRRSMSQANDDYSDQGMNSLMATNVTLKKRSISLYVSLCELKSFIQLNKTGFSKVLKKYDKTLDRSLKSIYIQNNVTPAYPFRETTMQQLDEKIQNVEKAYADLIMKGDIPSAKRDLRLHLREHVVWERNTVWREMIGIERKAQAANMGVRRTLLGGDQDPAKARLQGDDPDQMSSKEVVTPVGKYRCPSWLFSSTFFSLVVIIAIFVVLLVVPIMKKPEQQNCLAMLVFVSLLWATEVSLVSLFVDPALTPWRSFPCS